MRRAPSRAGAALRRRVGAIGAVVVMPVGPLRAVGARAVVGPRRSAVVDVALGATGHDIGDRRVLTLAPLRLAPGELRLTAVELLVTGGQLALAAAQVVIAQAGLLDAALVLEPGGLGLLLDLGDAGRLLLLASRADPSASRRREQCPTEGDEQDGGAGIDGELERAHGAGEAQGAERDRAARRLGSDVGDHGCS